MNMLPVGTSLYIIYIAVKEASIFMNCIMSKKTYKDKTEQERDLWRII
jgi:hypothetical protein